MRCTIAVWFVLSSLAFTQNSTSIASSTSGTPVQVLYVAAKGTLYTYDIDPQTLQPSLLGTTPLPKPQLNGIAASSDGKFLYLMAADPYPSTSNGIYVYDTDANGVPGSPLQSIAAANQYSMVVDPAGRFLYTVETGTANNQVQPSSIYRYQIDSTTGELTKPVNEATYILPVQATNYCSLSIVAIDVKGTEIYDSVFCGTHEGETGIYDERALNPSDGTLGSPLQTLKWSVDSIGIADSAQFVKGLMFDFQYPVAGQPYNDLRIYSLSASGIVGLLACTASMLPACGSDTGMVHPSANYVFYSNSQTNTTEVDAVELSSKQIVATGTTFATPQPNRLAFSPDGAIVYSWETESSVISILGFNASTAAITTGGSISESNTASILAAERY